MFVTAYPQPQLYPSLPADNTANTDKPATAKETLSPPETDLSPPSLKASSSHRRKAQTSRRVLPSEQRADVSGPDTVSQRKKQDTPSLNKLLGTKESKGLDELGARSTEGRSSLNSLLKTPTTTHVPVNLVMEAYKYGVKKGMMLAESPHVTEELDSDDPSVFLTALVEQKGMEKVLSLIPLPRASPTHIPLPRASPTHIGEQSRVDKPSASNSHVQFTQLGKHQTAIIQDSLPDQTTPPSKRTCALVQPTGRKDTHLVSKLKRTSLGGSVKHSNASGGASCQRTPSTERASPPAKPMEGVSGPKHAHSPGLLSATSGLASMLAEPLSIVDHKERKIFAYRKERDHSKKSPSNVQLKTPESVSPRPKQKSSSSWIANLFPR